MNNNEVGGNVYELTYLEKSGIRFTLNIVDTVYLKGLGFSFYALTTLVLLLLLIKDNDFLIESIFIKKSYYQIFIASLIIYLLINCGKYCYFYYVRKKLRLDLNPIIVEAYAIVLVSDIKDKKLALNKERSVVLYKECGTTKPRFFTSAIKSFNEIEFNKEQIARVFIDRAHPKYYSIDDESCLAPFSQKKKIFLNSTVLGGSNKSADVDTKENNKES